MGAHAAHFVFGGVAFELLADSASEPRLGGALERYLLPASAGDGLPQVVVALSWDRQLAAPGDRRLHGSAEASECVEFSARHLRGRLRALGPGRYALHARVAPGLEGLTALLLEASRAVVQREGGLELQATAVELDGRALLLVGPRGAGKSTACELIAGATCLAYDRVALAPGAGGRWRVWALPGGRPPRTAPSAKRVELPLAGLLRVRRGEQRPRVEPLDGSAALCVVYEAVPTSLSDAHLHERSPGALRALCDEVPVGALYTVLGQPLGALVRGFLGGSRVRPGPAAQL